MHGLDFFRCEKCGSRELRVVRHVTRYNVYSEELGCSCGTADNGIAAAETRTIMMDVREVGWLDEGHRVEWDPGDEENQEEKIDEEEDVETFCPKCRADPEEEWQSALDEEESGEDPDSVEYYVHCGGECGREIEFGWSHPDRGGRIWPAECTDFNPWKCWPEPRYVDAWKQKGWLRPPETAPVGGQKRGKEQGQALHESVCAWCERTIPDEHEVFGLGAKARPDVDLSPYRGHIFDITIATLGRTVPVTVVGADSQAARDGKDFHFMTCSEACAQALKAALGEDVLLGRELLGP